MVEESSSGQVRITFPLGSINQQGNTKRNG